ncbi:DNA primase [Domibacillus epiphyticus]|uniref:DNA primase n=1 Tax=Domibacillus epiphyticus TaxID=1714355 RepID=A0A1V2A9M8_9BACI|nr:DNA primase [Domibacillus epiphyticus]OMP67650.1 DNA primase [Domibacillus epiphyticus]
MAGRIPEETIQQIKQGVDIADVIGDYVQLKKQGRNYFGLCPFHGENSPSFSVSPEKQIYHCFGCGAGGNAFTFLMEIDQIPFQEAAARLADLAGVTLDISPSQTIQPSKSNEYADFLEAHALMAKFYRHLLLNTNEGNEALHYLHERGFTDEDIDRFQIGWSLPQNEFSLNVLQKRGFDPARMEEAGLLLKKEETGRYYDRFRGRIMFPIHDERGNVVGFSGRGLENVQPKYLNSPETALFHKSSLLYNFHVAKTAIKRQKQFILFEGFADVIAAVRAGFDQSVAVMGTSLTEEHVRLLKKIANEAIICYDGDNAGLNAAYKAADMLDKNGISVNVTMLPDGLDPDEFIKRNGHESFAAYVKDASLTLMAFKMEYFKRGKNLREDSQKFRYIEDVLVEIAGLKKAVERDHYLRRLADEFSLSLQALQEQEKALFLKKRADQPGRKEELNKHGVVLKARPVKQYPRHETAERRLLAHMLNSPDVAERVRVMMQGESFTIDEHQALYTYLLGYYEQADEPDTASFLTVLTDEQLRRLAVDISLMTVNGEPGEEELLDYVKEINKQRRRFEIEEKKRERDEAEKRHDYVGAARILNDIIAIEKSLTR